MPILGFLLFQIRIVNLLYKFINGQTLNKSFNPITTLNDMYLLIQIYIKCIIIL